MWGAEYFVVAIGTLTVLLAIIGHIALVVPARNDPRCLVQARLTYWFGLVGMIVGSGYALAVWPEPLIAGPALGVLLGGLAGCGAGKLFSLWLLAGESENRQ